MAAWYTVVGAVVLAGCSALFDAPTERNPTLEYLFLGGSDRLAHDGVLVVNAVPFDHRFRLSEHERVPIRVRTSGGDNELVHLYSKVCGHQRGPSYFCYSFTMVMDSGVVPLSLSPVVAKVPARIGAAGTRSAAVFLFTPHRAARVAREAWNWPGVSYTELLGVGSCAVLPCSIFIELSAPVPVDTGRANVGDGILQVRSGDTVITAYEQPSGLVLEAQRLVP